jgi:heme exporter protein D
MSFFAMGGYAAFIWPAYGISALALAAAVGLTVKGWRDAQARLKALEEKKP